jgi:hypothetical protein
MFKIKECIEKKAIKSGQLVTVLKNKLALALYPRNSELQRYNNMRNLEKKKALTREFIVIICQELDVTADELCDIKK